MPKQTQIAIAVLTATQPTNMAVLTGTFDITNDEWVQLLPDGDFAAVDGRPFDVPSRTWRLDAEIAARVIARVQARANDLVIDYEHQTLETEKNGKPAPAAGWFKDIEYRPGQGLFIRPVWTAPAALHIQNKEYRYLSAVFPYNKATGEVLDLQMAAITNFPGIDGMTSLAALAAQKFPVSTTPPHQPGENPMWKTLLAKLGINLAEGVEPTSEQIQSAIAALTALKTKADEADALTETVAALKAAPGNVDLKQYVPVTTYNAVVSELAVLRQSSHSNDVGQLIEQAHKEGKVLAAEKDYLTQFGAQHGFAELKALLGNRPAIAALKQSQSSDTQAPKTEADALSAEELAVCKACGISADEFRKNKAGSQQ